MATIEEPSRAITQLTNLARGHALSQGRSFITKEDVSIVIKVVLSTASIERVAVFDLLLAHGGKLQTPVIIESLNVTSPTANRTMTEFKAIGLVDGKDIGSSHINEITLKPEFDWFLTEEFQELRDNYKSEKYIKTEKNDTSNNYDGTSNANCSINAKGDCHSGSNTDTNNNYNSDPISPTPVFDIPLGDTVSSYAGREPF